MKWGRGCLILLVGIFAKLSYAQTSSGAPRLPAPTQPTTTGNNMAQMTPQTDYIYDPTGKKDPFKPYRAPRIRGDNRKVAPIDPLTLLDVSQLQLVAVMWNTEKPRAVVKDNAGKTFVLLKNMHIGRNDGIVVDIREGEVVIVEKFDDGFGNTIREARTLEMKLPDPSAAAGG